MEHKIYISESFENNYIMKPVIQDSNVFCELKVKRTLSDNFYLSLELLDSNTSFVFFKTLIPFKNLSIQSSTNNNFIYIGDSSSDNLINLDESFNVFFQNIDSLCYS